jgi:hypothetical protein
MVNFAFGQNYPQNWSREYFIENEINVLSAYSYEFDENGNIKDSFLLFKRQFDIQNNKIVSNDNGYNNETYYNNIGQIIKYRIIPSIGDEDSNVYNITDFEIDYKYDRLNREIKATKKIITKYYSKQDSTLLSQSIYTEIDESIYNSNNQIIESYYTVDVKDIRTKRNRKKESNAVNCYSCQPRHLSAKWKYDASSNLTEFISFIRNNDISSVKNYFYDDQNRLVKKTESNSIFMLSIFTYEYTDTGKIETGVHNVENKKMMYKTISHYDNDDKIVKKCHTNHGSEEIICEEYFYFYEKDKLIKKITKHISEDIVTYYYNDKGLLTEQQAIQNGKIIELIRYYYE